MHTRVWTFFVVVCPTLVIHFLVIRSIVAQAAPTDAVDDRPTPAATARLSAGALEKRLHAVYEKVSPAIVRIVSDDRRIPHANGVIVSEQGHILTRTLSERMRSAESIAGHLPGGRRVRARPLGWSDEFGIGLLQITTAGSWPHVDIRAASFVFAPTYREISPSKWPTRSSHETQ